MSQSERPVQKTSSADTLATTRNTHHFSWGGYTKCWRLTTEVVFFVRLSSAGVFILNTYDPERMQDKRTNNKPLTAAKLGLAVQRASSTHA